jgi:hypothetical protein
MNILTNEALDEFVDYVYDYYGDEGLFKDMFKGYAPVTKAEIQTATFNLVQTPCPWGGGDTMDREIVRDCMLVARGVTRVEYAPGIRKYNIVELAEETA